ncbi:hypothetical protein M3O57_20525, partial [Xanthomonas nasturtii]|uniref:hypothetical protein n=1 Tax=Xanthomonas nasturtii TaxID=1843581 RepID=UPI0020122FEB
GTACAHGRKLPETSAYINENWQFQHAENAGDGLQWMWLGVFQGRPFSLETTIFSIKRYT